MTNITEAKTRLIQGSLEDVYFAKSTSVEQLSTELDKNLQHLPAWQDHRNPQFFKNNDRDEIQVTSIMDIEESTFSPRYGLKGNIDATLEIRKRLKRTDQESVYLCPLEIKSGHSTSLAHRTQTILYSLMLSEKHGSFLFASSVE